MSELIGETFRGNVFVQDANPAYIKIEAVLLGESPQFGYKTVHEDQIGKLLNDCLNDDNAALVLYDWEKNVGYVKTGFDFYTVSDSKNNPKFTTFLVKSRVSYKNRHYFDESPVPPYPIPIPPVILPSSKIPVLAPYLYAWAYNDPQYEISKCMDIVNKIGGNAVTIAFVIGESADGIINTFDADFKEFKARGGQLIISFGGADGVYMEIALSIEAAVKEISKLIDATGCRALDFDIEGKTLENTSLNDKRATIIRILQEKYPGLYVSFTIPANLDEGIIWQGRELINNAIANGVSISIVNIMAMDIGPLPIGSNWGVVVQQIAEMAIAQLQQIYPTKTLPELYRMLGITVMIGKNDDPSIFKPDDSFPFAEYAKRNNIGLVSYWSINRDQVGTGSLGVYSQVNSKDFEFFENIKGVLGTLGTLPNAEYVHPLPPQDTWKSSVIYNVGDSVILGGKTYIYTSSHISSDVLRPDITPSLWLLS